MPNKKKGKWYEASIIKEAIAQDVLAKHMRYVPIAINIAFLENNLENLFVSPAGREMFKYKPNTKLKPKINPNLEFFTTIQNGNRQSNTTQESNKPNEKCDVSSSSSNTTSYPSTSSTSDSQRSSIDLYEEAAAILGLACSQTDDCRCIECQCHYFDFEEEIDFPTTGNEYGKLLNVDHTSSCSIQ